MCYTKFKKNQYVELSITKRAEQMCYHFKLCFASYYGVMAKCWRGKPKQRPSFKDISTDIGKTFNVAPSDEYYYYSEK